MPTTKNKKPTIEEQQAEVAAEFESEYAAAETILRDACASGRRLTFDEVNFVKTRLGLADDRAVKNELRRINAVMQLELIGGKTADRKAAAKLAADAAKTLETEGPDLQRVIAEAQATLAKMEKESATTARRVDQMNDAALQTREHCPLHVKARHNLRKAEIKETLGRKFKDLQTELRHRKLLCAEGGGPSWNSREYSDLIRLHYRGRFHRQQGHHIVFDAAGFEPTRKELAETIPALQAECDAAKAEFEAALAKNDELLNYYSAR